MNAKVVFTLALALSSVGVYFRLTAPPKPLDRLMQAPKDPALSTRGGMTEVELSGPLSAAREKGCVTVVAVYSSSCPRCATFRRRIRDFLDERSDVAFRMVNVGDRWNPGQVSERYATSITSVPHVAIFDADGRVLAADNGKDNAGLDLLYDWMKTEQHRRGSFQAAGAN